MLDNQSILNPNHFTLTGMLAEPIYRMQLEASPLRKALQSRLPLNSSSRILSNSKIPASVLLLLVERNHEIHLWFVRRAQHLNKHHGQVAFPGGKYESHDSSYVDTALRETQEEIGIPSSEIEILGSLPSLDTPTGYQIFPFVGWLQRDLTPNPDLQEIAYAFSSPLTQLFQAEPCLFHGQGVLRLTLSYTVDTNRIWGATARILSNFMQIVRSISMQEK